MLGPRFTKAWGHSSLEIAEGWAGPGWPGVLLKGFGGMLDAECPSQVQLVVVRIQTSPSERFPWALLQTLQWGAEADPTRWMLFSV